MSAKLKWAFVAAALLAPILALAGFGDMGRFEYDEDNGVSLGDMAIGALIVAGAIALWNHFF